MPVNTSGLQPPRSEHSSRIAAMRFADDVPRYCSAMLATRFSRSRVACSTADLDEAISVSRPPMWFLIDPEVPGTVKSVLLARERVDVYMFAVSASAERKTPPGLVRTLLDRWIADQCSFLGLLAVLPGVDLPESDVPREFRLDLHSIASEHDAAERAYQLRLATARTRGASTVFGIPRDDGQA